VVAAHKSHFFIEQQNKGMTVHMANLKFLIRIETLFTLKNVVFWDVVLRRTRVN
jgi:hypothetical protein